MDIYWFSNLDDVTEFPERKPRAPHLAIAEQGENAHWTENAAQNLLCTKLPHNSSELSTYLCVIKNLMYDKEFTIFMFDKEFKFKFSKCYQFKCSL